MVNYGSMDAEQMSRLITMDGRATCKDRSIYAGRKGAIITMKKWKKS
jgi:hypothetical protein